VAKRTVFKVVTSTGVGTSSPLNSGLTKKSAKRTGVKIKIETIAIRLEGVLSLVSETTSFRGLLENKVGKSKIPKIEIFRTILNLFIIKFKDYF